MRGGEDPPELLQGPPRRRVTGDVDVQEPLAPHLQRHEDVEHAERRGHWHAEVAGNQNLSMIPDEGRPPMAGRALPFPAEPAAHGAAGGAR